MPNYAMIVYRKVLREIKLSLFLVLTLMTAYLTSTAGFFYLSHGTQYHVSRTRDFSSSLMHTNDLKQFYKHCTLGFGSFFF